MDELTELYREIEDALLALRPLLTPNWREDVLWQRIISRRDGLPTRSAYVFEANGCVNWQGARKRYGHASDCGRPAYRAVYEHFYGAIPCGFHVHHTCGNPRCCAPAHLIAVSARDHRLLTALNPQKSGGRLDRVTAAAVLVLVRQGDSRVAAAERFNISRSLVTMIVNGDRWPELTLGRPDLLARAAQRAGEISAQKPTYETAL